MVSGDDTGLVPMITRTRATNSFLRSHTAATPCIGRPRVPRPDVWVQAPSHQSPRLLERHRRLDSLLESQRITSLQARESFSDPSHFLQRWDFRHGDRHGNSNSQDVPSNRRPPCRHTQPAATHVNQKLHGLLAFTHRLAEERRFADHVRTTGPRPRFKASKGSRPTAVQDTQEPALPIY